MTLEPNPAPGANQGATRGATARLVLVSAFLSAILASGATAALLIGSAPATGLGPITPIVAASATARATAPAGATVTKLDASDAVVAVAAAVEPSVVTIAATSGGRTASAGGSGIIVSADGLILTTAVVAPVDTTYTILLADQRETTARVVAADAAHGLVLLRAQATRLTPATIGSAGALTVGQLVVAVGSPLGEFTDTVTAGIVSGLDRTIDLQDPSTGRRVALDGLVQTDAAINAGSSGGPLLDAAGTVVGVIVTSAGDGEGIGFAIPIGAAKALLAQVPT
jgi:S1-C subfamily serine protease